MAHFMVKVNKRQYSVVVPSDDVKTLITIANFSIECGILARRIAVLLLCAQQHKITRATALQRANKLIGELETLAVDIWADYTENYGAAPIEQTFIFDFVADCKDFMGSL